MKDPQKEVDFPPAPYHTGDSETWFRWMAHHPNVVEAVDAAENAGLLRSLLHFAVGWIGQDMRHDADIKEAERKAAEQAAWRDFTSALMMNGADPF